MQRHSTRGDPDAALASVAPAVSGFFRSVALGQAAGDRTGNLQVGACGGFSSLKLISKLKQCMPLQWLCRPAYTHFCYPFLGLVSNTNITPNTLPQYFTPPHLQDILRLLTLWFAYGSYPDVEKALQEGFALVSIDTWLVVIPQVSIWAHGAVVCMGAWARKLFEVHGEAELCGSRVESGPRSPQRSPQCILTAY